MTDDTKMRDEYLKYRDCNGVASWKVWQVAYSAGRAAREPNPHSTCEAAMEKLSNETLRREKELERWVSVLKDKNWELERQLAEAREKLSAAIAAGEILQEASRKKGLAMERMRDSLLEIARLPLGDHQAKKLAESALKSS